MSLTIGEVKDLAAALQSLATIASFIVGGVWVYFRYVRQQERYPNIEFSVDILFIGTQESFWIVEIIASVQNKGKTQHRMEEFLFELNGLEKGGKVLADERWGNQVDFPSRIAEGSFLPGSRSFFFIDPGLKAKYSYITKVPTGISFVLVHAWFKYGDDRKLFHSAERTIAVPQDSRFSSVQNFNFG